MKVETVFLCVFQVSFSLPFSRSPLQSRMITEPSSSLTEHGPRHGPPAQRGKSALGSTQAIRSISSDLLPYPQSDLSCDLYLKQLMKPVPHVKLHVIQFSPSWKLTLKDVLSFRAFSFVMMYNPSWRVYGRASQSKHFPPYVIAPWQTEMLRHLITESAWHIQSQILWRRLAEGENALNSQSFLSRQWHRRH